MSVVYTIQLTDDHIVETYAQHRTQQKALLWLAWPMKIICALGLIALLGVGVFAKVYVVSAFAAFFLLLLAMGPRFDYWSMRRRWRRHPHFNELLRIEAADPGLSFTTPKSSGSAQWSVYTSAVARPQGVLLYSTKWEYFWLPDNAISEGSAAEVRDLLRSKLAVQDAV
jgi:hypothetical protein